jgi:UDP-N-acetylglucosamine--N-acetylmuramyl-(pentapeptide) pyrophosphoryl-undecaprenol N-acetylglucosamine transferase
MRVLISGGGTGGHLFPAIAVAQVLARSDPDGAVLFVGRGEGIEGGVVPRYGIRFASIPAAGLYTEEVWRNWRLPVIVPAAVARAVRLTRRFKPSVMLGTGGYVSAPVVLAAALCRVPIVLQEQNLKPGRATRTLARLARIVAVAYPESAAWLRTRVVVTGTPVRAEFTRRSEFPQRPAHLLVLGGSQGAHRINEAVSGAVAGLLGGPVGRITHQTGTRDLAAMLTVRDGLPSEQRDRYAPVRFIDDLGPVLGSADLVVSRAGASTLSEVSAVGVPRVVVPYPFAGAHQEQNVRPYAAAGSAVVIPDAECTADRLLADVCGISEDPGRYRRMVEGMAGLGRPDAAERVAGVLTEVAS